MRLEGKMTTSLITGITGQDGSLLADYLLSLGHKVVGITNHALLPEDKKSKNYKHLLNSTEIHTIDLTDEAGVLKLITAINPDHCYHLGAQSFPGVGFTGNYDGFRSNTQSVYNLLGALKETNPTSRFFFAGSSEVFGSNPEVCMNENSKFLPRTMYGISKLCGHELVRNYREQFAYHSSTGFLFNHESHRRGEEFVTRKITLAAAKIKLGVQKDLFLGSLDSKRDWSYAGDFVKAFHDIISLKEASDFVLGSGEVHTVREFVSIAFKTLNLNYEDFVKIDPQFDRPNPFYLVANTKKAKAKINWKPSKTFEELVALMVREDFDLCSEEAK
jgi:GDPmannose 4,6-dehydratase